MPWLFDDRAVQVEPNTGKIFGILLESVSNNSNTNMPDKENLVSAQDSAIPRKKDYFRELVHSLNAIKTHEYDGAEGGKNEKNRSIPSTPAHALGKVEEYQPINPKKAIRNLTPTEQREMIKKSCGLIKTVDKDLIPGIERRVKRIYTGASTPETLQRYLENVANLEPWQAERIINDQMNKFEAKAALERMKRQGVKTVRWHNGKCNEHRPSHIAPFPYGLNGCVFDINHPPVDPATGEPTMPGEQINCHCWLEPID